MATADTARTQLAAQQSGGAPVKRGVTLKELLEDNKQQIAQALPGVGVTPEQMVRVALTCVKQNPKLGECTPHSVAGAIMQAAHVGLLPGGTLGHAHLVPYWNPKEKAMEAQFQIGWQGLVSLARRSGEVAELWADVIKEQDTWAIKRGLDRDLIHEPNYLAEDRGDVLFAYAVVKYVSGARDWVVLDRAEIEKRKNQSQTGRKGFGPWNDHFDAMARKSAIKALAPFMPLALDDQRAIGSDGQVIRWDPSKAQDEVLEEVDVEDPFNSEPIEVESVERDEPDENGEVPISQLRKAQLVKRLHDAGLDTDGKVDDLRDRWRAHVEGDDQPDDEEDADALTDEQPDVADGPPPPEAPNEADEPDPSPEGEPAAATGEDGRPPSSPDSSYDWRDHADELGIGHAKVLVAVRDAMEGDERPNKLGEIDDIAATAPGQVRSLIEDLGAQA